MKAARMKKVEQLIHFHNESIFHLSSLILSFLCPLQCRFAQFANGLSGIGCAEDG